MSSSRPIQHSGLQLQVLSLYKKALQVAKEKDMKLASSQMNGDQLWMNNIKSMPATSYVRERFRKDAASVTRSNFITIEFLLRKGERDIKMLEKAKSAQYTVLHRSPNS